jgi:guanylate kinase
MKESGLFLESAKVHGNYYATSFEFIKNNLKEGKILIKDIDVEGTKQILNKLKKDVITIFVNAPSKEELEQRLTERRTDSTETIKKRLETAKKELEILEKTNIYKYTIINRDLEKAVDDLEKIIKENLQNDKSETNR